MFVHMETALIEHDGWQMLGKAVQRVVSGLHKMREGGRGSGALQLSGVESAALASGEGDARGDGASGRNG